MEQYMTLSEICAVWDADTRTVQNLCRSGRVEGAIKRAGSWFIPQGIPSPLKNNKSGSGKHPFIGTKKKIFDCSIELFSKNGFESVSLREIGDAVGITQSTIYNHFASKQELLDAIYDYLVENFYNKRAPVAEMKELLREGAKERFCTALMFTFDNADNEAWVRLTLITKMIYMRLFQDSRAQEIFLGLMNAEIEEYVNEILEYGVAIGALHEFDIRTYAKFLIGQRHIMGIKAFADPHYELQQLEDEAKIMQMSADMIPFVN